MDVSNVSTIVLFIFLVSEAIPMECVLSLPKLLATVIIVHDGVDSTEMMRDLFVAFDKKTETKRGQRWYGSIQHRIGDTVTSRPFRAFSSKRRVKLRIDGCEPITFAHGNNTLSSKFEHKSCRGECNTVLRFMPGGSVIGRTITTDGSRDFFCISFDRFKVDICYAAKLTKVVCSAIPLSESIQKSMMGEMTLQVSALPILADKSTIDDVVLHDVFHLATKDKDLLLFTDDVKRTFVISCHRISPNDVKVCTSDDRGNNGIFIVSNDSVGVTTNVTGSINARPVVALFILDDICNKVTINDKVSWEYKIWCYKDTAGLFKYRGL